MTTTFGYLFSALFFVFLFLGNRDSCFVIRRDFARLHYHLSYSFYFDYSVRIQAASKCLFMLISSVSHFCSVWFYLWSQLLLVLSINSLVSGTFFPFTWRPTYVNRNYSRYRSPRFQSPQPNYLQLQTPILGLKFYIPSYPQSGGPSQRLPPLPPLPLVNFLFSSNQIITSFGLSSIEYNIATTATVVGATSISKYSTSTTTVQFTYRSKWFPKCLANIWFGTTTSTNSWTRAWATFTTNTTTWATRSWRTFSAYSWTT